MRQATATFSRKRSVSAIVEGAPYKVQDLVANRYLIKDIVGAGPLGFVFRAHDKEIDVEVALKVINARMAQTADERKAFAKTMRSARKLSHPNLVRVYEEGEDQDRPYFTSQFLDGLTLRKIIDLRLTKGQFFALKEIEPILQQVANALDGAHKVGPHSDLKPENVLVLPDLLKVTDFGLGLAMPRLPFVQAMKTRKADRYLSPELAEGREVDLRADIYSMAVILGEMLSGLTPDGALPELQRRNPEVPQAIEGLYRKALNSNPLARPKTAGEFMGEFLEISRKVSPPPLKPRENASGSSPVARPRTNTGMLQLQPRRDKPPPPVPTGDLPPPPPPISEEVAISSLENVPPDATQPVDPARLKDALNGYGINGNGHAPKINGASEVADAAPEGDHEETEVIQSGQLLAGSPEDDVETRAAVPVVREPVESEEPKKSRTGMWLLILGVIGIGVGAVGGSVLLKRLSAQQTQQPPGTVETPKPPAVDPVAAEELRKQEEARAAAQRQAEEEAAAKEAERLAAERKAAQAANAPPVEPSNPNPNPNANSNPDKAAQAKAAAEKAAQEKAEAAEKAAAEKAAAQEKAAAEKAALAEKLAAEKLAGEKTPKETKTAAVAPPAAAGDGPCPEGMRQVAGGTFKFGATADDPMRGFDEKNLQTVDVAAFCVDLFEFPNKRGTNPTVNVSFSDAKRLCEGKGKRLCSEEEWEKACKGPGNARFPYGNGFDPNACNTQDEAGDDRTMAPAGRFAKCRSGYGVADLSGNVSEWTADKVVKGGSFGKGDSWARCAARTASGGGRGGEIGFRCCADSR